MDKGEEIRVFRFMICKCMCMYADAWKCIGIQKDFMFRFQGMLNFFYIDAIYVSHAGLGY